MKKITALALVLMMSVVLTACTPQMGNGGHPTPNKVTSGKYEAEPEKVILYKIDDKTALPLLTELTEIIGKMADGVYESDMHYLKKVVAYLAQFNDYNGDLPQYMHSVELLCDAYYDLYVLNCTADDVKKVIDDYFNGYYALSEKFRSQHSPFETADLYSIMNKIDEMAQAAVASSDASSAPSSQKSK